VFVGTDSWSYYARPQLGLAHEFTVADIEAAAARKRELGQPESFEWVHETTPSLLGAARSAGLEVLEAPLLVLDRGSWRVPEAPAGMTLRILEPDDRMLPAALAVQIVGFDAPGTATGPEGLEERVFETTGAGENGFLQERMRRGLTVVAVAEAEYGPASAGMHKPVEGVSEIVGVATLPAVRRQGLGGAVTGALVEDAVERGVGTVFISAGSEAIARIYARLGFKRVGTACFVG
jgi:ribosomal protein S18 acetylase RimI-like enzyme